MMMTKEEINSKCTSMKLAIKLLEEHLVDLQSECGHDKKINMYIGDIEDINIRLGEWDHFFYCPTCLLE